LFVAVYTVLNAILDPYIIVTSIAGALLILLFAAILLLVVPRKQRQRKKRWKSTPATRPVATVPTL
jgi:membrane protein YdbS with pleckstrin-like domain